MSEETNSVQKGDAIDVDKLKDAIANIYPVRYERRTAVAPLLWICGAMFTSSLVWCTVNMVLVDCNWYRIVIVSFALLVAGVSFVVAIRTMFRILKDSKNVAGKDYNPRWDLLRSEHFLIEMHRRNALKDGKDYGDTGKDTGDSTNKNSDGNETASN